MDEQLTELHQALEMYSYKNHIPISLAKQSLKQALKVNALVLLSIKKSNKVRNILH